MRGGVRRLGAACACAAIIGASVTTFLVPGRADAAAQCRSGLGAEGTDIKETPWPIRRFGLERLNGIADGSDVRVAVIDSGIDAKHQLLQGVVVPGLDVLDGADGLTDCVGHGTAVASIIAGKALPGIGFRGIATGARVVAVRVSDQLQIESTTPPQRTSPAQLASAIRRSVDEQKARVLNLSLVLYNNDPGVQEAIAHAIRQDVVVVAAVGNNFQDGNATPYPAAYQGVIGVGAINEDGRRWEKSQVGNYVDLVAPGGDIIAATRTKGLQGWSGTSFAAPVVTATAALIRSYYPSLTAQQVADRILATADPAPGGLPRSPEYGVGVVNPYRAVTARIGGVTESLQALPARSRDAAAERAAERAEWTRSWALGLAMTGGGIAGLVVLGAAVLPRGTRRRWRPGTRPLPTPPTPEDEEALV